MNLSAKLHHTECDIGRHLDIKDTQDFFRILSQSTHLLFKTILKGKKVYLIIEDIPQKVIMGLS